jgi:hypothetical protein
MLRLQQKYNRPVGTRFIAVVVLIAVSLLSGLMPPLPAAAMTSQAKLAELPLTFPVQSTEIATYFNQIARPQDIAAFPVAHIRLLPEVTAGQKRIGFASWAEAEGQLPGLTGQIEIVAYNAEHWKQTPKEEQKNLPATVQRAAEFAHAQGFQFMFSPDRRFAQEHVSEVAPYVDIIGLQGQRLQEDPQAFAAWMNEMISAARASNPEVQIYAQVGATQGPAPQMLAALQAVAGEIDGISVWSTPKTFDTLKEFVSLLRENSAITQAPAAPTATPSPTMISTTEISTATPTSTPTAVAVSESSSMTSTPSPTLVSTKERAEATPTPEQVIAKANPPAAQPTRQAQSPQTKQLTSSGTWPTQLAYIAGGVFAGLLLGIAIARRRGSG